MLRTILLCLLGQYLAISLVAAQVKIGGNPTTINGGSVLELESTNQGLYLSRVSLTATTTWGLAGTAPSTAATGGMVVYNTNSGITGTGASGIGIYYWDGTKWNYLQNYSNTSTTGNFWSLTGNSGTTPSTAAYGSAVNNNFIGTTDTKDFVFATDNLERMRIASGGYVGIGISTPNKPLYVVGFTSNSNVITIENKSSSGYSSLDAYDNTGSNLSSTFGFGNSAVGDARFVSRAYINAYGNDFILTDNVSSGTYAFLLSKTNGYVGFGTKTPLQPIEVGYTNGTVRIDALKTGGSFNSSATNSNSNIVYANKSTGDLYALPTVNNAVLVTDGTGVPSWSTSPAGWISGSGTTTIFKTSFSKALGTLSSNTPVTFTIPLSGITQYASIILNPRSSLNSTIILWSYASATNSITFSIVYIGAGSYSPGTITFDVAAIQ